MFMTDFSKYPKGTVPVQGGRESPSMLYMQASRVPHTIPVAMLDADRAEQMQPAANPISGKKLLTILAAGAALLNS